MGICFSVNTKSSPLLFANCCGIDLHYFTISVYICYTYREESNISITGWEGFFMSVCGIYCYIIPPSLIFQGNTCFYCVLGNYHFEVPLFLYSRGKSYCVSPIGFHLKFYVVLLHQSSV